MQSCSRAVNTKYVILCTSVYVSNTVEEEGAIHQCSKCMTYRLLWTKHPLSHQNGFVFLSLKHRNDTTRLEHELQRPFGVRQDYEDLLTRFCALAFGRLKVGQTCLPVTKHPGEWQLYLCVCLFLLHRHTHTHSLACGQCTDVITDIPGCYLISILLKDAFDKWCRK